MNAWLKWKGAPMSNQLDLLILDLCEWVGAVPRPYRDVMDAWRTSCPRLTVWEDAVDLGLVVRQVRSDGTPVVALTDKGARFLQSNRRGITPKEGAARTV